MSPRQSKTLFSAAELGIERRHIIAALLADLLAKARAKEQGR